MANEQGLKVLLAAELSDFLKDMKAAKDAIIDTASSTAEAVKSFLGFSASAEEASKSAEDLAGALNDESTAANTSAKSWNQLGKFIFDQTYQRKTLIQQVNQGVGSWKLEAKAVQEAGFAFNTTLKPIAGAGNALKNTQKEGIKTGAVMAGVNNVIRDMPYGFNAIANNITQVADAIFGASAAAAAATFGISVIVTTITALVQKYGSLSNAVAALTGGLSQQEKIQQEVTDSLKGASNEYTKAVVNVAELKDEIALAKKGFIDKTDVVNHYNKTIGETTGQVKTLEEAEKSLQKNADAYIKFTLLKAAANVAQQKAADKAFEAELTNRKKLDEFSSAPTANKQGILSFLTTDVDDVKAIKKQNEEFRKARKDEALKTEKADQANLESIAKSFRDQAAALAQQYKFDFIPDPDKDDTKKKVKTVTDVLKELNIEFATIDAQAQATGATFKDLGKDKIGALNKAIGELVKIGIKPGDKLFVNLQKQAEDIQAFMSGQNFNLTAPKIQVPVEIEPLPKLQLTAIKGLSDDFHNVFNELNGQLVYDAQQIGVTLSQSFSGIGESIGQALSGGGFDSIVLGMGNLISDVLQKMGQDMIKLGIAMLAIKKGLTLSFSNPAFAIAAGVAAIAAGALIKASTQKSMQSNVPHFATGGVVNGPTLAMVGDNPSGVEYMIPKEILDKLGGNNGFGGRLVARVAGTDLEFVLTAAEAENNRYGHGI